jgi:hypothetical protein
MELVLFFGTSAAACTDRLLHAISRVHLQLLIITLPYLTAELVDRVELDNLCLVDIIL